LPPQIRLPSAPV